MELNTITQELIPAIYLKSDRNPAGVELTQNDVDGLWASALAQGNSMSLRVASDSMRPLMAAGDRIVVEPLPSGRRPHVGEIVLLRTHDGWLVHRIVGTSGKGAGILFLQKGDAGHHAQEVPPSAIMGRVTAIETRDGTIQLNNHFQSGVSMMAGRSFQLVDWLLNRGSDLGRDKESGAASPARVVVSRLVRRLERGIAGLGSWLARRSIR